MAEELHKRVKVPTIFQMEATECGAASLAMILAYYKLWLPLETVRQECGVNRDGSKAGKIVLAARKFGCKADGFKSTAKKLRKREFPVIIYWEFNHFVVLEGLDDKYAYLNDPAVGRRKVLWDDFKSSYTGLVLDIRPGENFKPGGSPYRVTKELAKKILQDKPTFAFVTLLSLCLIIPGMVTPVFDRIFIDSIVTMKRPEWISNLVIAMLITIFIVMLLNILRSLVLTQWQRKLTLADSSSFIWHALRLPMGFFQQRYAAEVASRAASSEQIASILSGPVATSVLDFCVAVFFLIILLLYSVKLTLIGVLFTALNIGVFLWLRQRIIDLNMFIQQNYAKEYGTLMNGLTVIESIKANGTESDFFAKWAGYHTKVVDAIQKVQIWSMASTLAPALFAGLNTAIIMTIGGFSIMSGAMTAGIFIAFQSMMSSFQAPVNKLVGLGTSLQSTEISMKRLDDVMKNPIDSYNYPSEDVARKQHFTGNYLKGDVEFRNVCFGYSPLDPPFIENFNLHITPGKWVALVGSSGSGKSTLSRIMMGVYQPDAGEILLDGIRREEIPREIIVTSLSSVDQDTFFMTSTVSESIAMFDISKEPEDIERAAKDACIHEDILCLDGGYNGMVMEGGRNFSGGQCQRLEIARALANNPSIIVLDEATSALDPVTEKAVMDNIRKRGCSCLVVAHRLSTIRDCDEIIVLEHGKVVERGTHAEMVQHDGPYRRLLEENTASNQSLN